jgi:hypothetical protein
MHGYKNLFVIVCVCIILFLFLVIPKIVKDVDKNRDR